MSDSQTLVVKLGTSVLTGGSRRLNRAHIVELVRQCAQLHAAGHRIVIVTSGAIAAGREHLGYPEQPRKPDQLFLEDYANTTQAIREVFNRHLAHPTED